MTTRRLLLQGGLAVLTAQAAGPAYAAAPRFSAQRLARVSEVAREMIARGFAPGAVTLITQRGRTVLAQADGYADLERRTPMRMDSLFRIYSMTKPLTTVVAMRLVEQGRLGLGDPVSRYVPGFGAVKVYAGGETLETLKLAEPTRPVTITDLMRHTAGLTYAGDGSAVAKLYAWRGVPTGSGADKPGFDGSPPPVTLAQFADLIAGVPLVTQPGEAFTYGNGVDVLGRVIEVVTGRRLRDVMAEELFAPLRMHDTSFAAPSGDPRMTSAYLGTSAPKGPGVMAVGELTTGKLVRADDGLKSVFVDRPIDFGGAGAVSTAADYMRFLRMMIGGGSLDGARILRPATVAMMTRNQLPEKALRTPGLEQSGLGFGLGFATFRDRSKVPAAVPEGGYFWAGAASTYFWADPRGQAAGVFMTQVFGDDVRAFYLRMLDALYG